MRGLAIGFEAVLVGLADCGRVLAVANSGIGVAMVVVDGKGDGDVDDVDVDVAVNDGDSPAVGSSPSFAALTLAETTASLSDLGGVRALSNNLARLSSF